MNAAPLSRRRSRGDRPAVTATGGRPSGPPCRFNCLWVLSFHLQFHDLRLATKSLPYLQGAALAQAAVLRRPLSLFHIRPECRFAVYPK